MEEMHESSSEEMNFSQEEVVWAKITGYPWWPALITANPLPGSNAFRVDFFADNTQYTSSDSAPSWPAANSQSISNFVVRSTSINI